MDAQICEFVSSFCLCELRRINIFVYACRRGKIVLVGTSLEHKIINYVHARARVCVWALQIFTTLYNIMYNGAGEAVCEGARGKTANNKTIDVKIN